MYGTQDFHEVLRIETIEHMKQHSGFYRQYMAVNNVRRNPKRKTAAALSTRLEATAYTEDELQLQFEQHVEKMGQPGEWADNMEVSAFASAFHVHVRLWQADYTILISPSFDYQYDEPGAVDDRHTLHIAYHASSRPSILPCTPLNLCRLGSTIHRSATMRDLTPAYRRSP